MLPMLPIGYRLFRSTTNHDHFDRELHLQRIHPSPRSNGWIRLDSADFGPRTLGFGLVCLDSAGLTLTSGQKVAQASSLSSTNSKVGLGWIRLDLPGLSRTHKLNGERTRPGCSGGRPRPPPRAHQREQSAVVSSPPRP